jgi:hypothetical protein
MKKSLLLICFLVMPLIAMAQGKIPQFKDYPAEAAYKGKNAPLKLTKDNRDYRTRLRAAAKEKPDFAGRYILTTWGCGTACLVGAVVDAKKGSVTFLPGAIYADSRQNIAYDYKLNSRLLIIYGTIDQKGFEGEPKSHYFEFKNGKFRHIKSIK